MVVGASGKLLSIIDDADIACGNALMVDTDGNPTGEMLNNIDNLYFFDAEKSLFRFYSLLVSFKVRLCL